MPTVAEQANDRDLSHVSFRKGAPSHRRHSDAMDSKVDSLTVLSRNNLLRSRFCSPIYLITARIMCVIEIIEHNANLMCIERLLQKRQMTFFNQILETSIKSKLFPKTTITLILETFKN